LAFVVVGLWSRSQPPSAPSVDESRWVELPTRVANGEDDDEEEECIAMFSTNVQSTAL
jgi:hypothetical protein